MPGVPVGVPGVPVVLGVPGVPSARVRTYVTKSAQVSLQASTYVLALPFLESVPFFAAHEAAD